MWPGAGVGALPEPPRALTPRGYASRVRIREAAEAELDFVSELLAAAWAQYEAPAEASEERRRRFTDYKASVSDVRSRLHDSTLLIAESDGRVLGSVTYYPPRWGVLVGENWPEGWAGIRLLGVHPDARGRGAGRLLTEECLRRARADGATHVGLHTTVLMTVAKSMYERMGFTRYPQNDFNAGDDFIVEAYEMKLA